MMTTDEDIRESKTIVTSRAEIIAAFILWDQEFKLHPEEFGDSTGSAESNANYLISLLEQK